MTPLIVTIDSQLLPGTEEQAPVKFALALAHEVRNPLTNINLSVKMLQLAINDKELKPYLDIIIRSSARINEMISDMLKQQAEVVEDEPLSLYHLLEEVLVIAGDSLRLKNIRIVREYAEDVRHILVNGAKMKIALTNIIINAADAMNFGEGELKLIIKSVHGIPVVQIRDNGCGISQENLKHIFKPYYTNKPNGLGIGLAATYDILRSNQVGVKVESIVGEGTGFILLFGKHYRKRFLRRIPTGNHRVTEKILTVTN